MICGRLDCTEINNIELFTETNLTKKVYSNNAEYIHVYIDHCEVITQIK